MLDLVVLVVLFLALVGTLALFQYLPQLFRSQDPALGLRLLEDWLQAHNLDLPSVEDVISVLNEQLEKTLESEEIERMTISQLLPKTELPNFSLYHAELSADNTDVMLSCTAEWPMCLPGVRVEVKEKDQSEVSICHFSIDWMAAQMKITLSDSDGKLLLSYRNTQPFRMGVACMVTEGSPKDADRMASQVADTLQLTLMALSLDRVPVLTSMTHPPPPSSSSSSSAGSSPSVPQVLVSSVDEESSAGSHDGRGERGCPMTDHAQTSPTEGVVGETESSERVGKEKDETEEEDGSVTQPVGESAVHSSDDGGETPTVSKRDPVGNHVTTESSSYGDRDDESTTSSHSHSSHSHSLTALPSLAPAGDNSPATATKANPPHHLVNGTGDIPLLSHQGSQGNGRIRMADVDIIPPSPDLTPQLRSPGWRRTPSYEQLEAISLEEGVLKHRSNSTDHLASPTRLAFISSPSGKKSLTLSIAGSEAESVYGADERIPSMLVFEIEEVNGRVRHFVAMSTSHAIKMRQRYKAAKKLHIYNNHLFTASKLKNKTAECAVCKEKLNKLFGKKGYICRCCGVIVHKECHCKVEDLCVSSTVHSMKLIYPDDKGVSTGKVLLSP